MYSRLRKTYFLALLTHRVVDVLVRGLPRSAGCSALPLLVLRARSSDQSGEVVVSTDHAGRCKQEVMRPYVEDHA